MDTRAKKYKNLETVRQHDLRDFLYFFERGLYMTLALIVILLLGIMTTVWGNLPKAQDDAETIEEAIARLIGVHEAEPTSHTGDGEAIDVHRKNEIIDHPAQSVVFDKRPFQEYEEYEAGIGSVSWSDETGASSGKTARNVTASLFSQTAYDGLMLLPNQYGASYPDADLMYQFALTYNGFQNSDGTNQLTFTNDVPEDSTVIYFEKSGTSLYFKIKVGGTVVSSTLLSVSNNVKTYFRFYYEHLTTTFYLYQGSTVVVTYEASDLKALMFRYVYLNMARSTNTSVSLTFNNWKCTYSRNID
jgi:hypothetical protein